MMVLRDGWWTAFDLYADEAYLLGIRSCPVWNPILRQQFTCKTPNVAFIKRHLIVYNMAKVALIPEMLCSESRVPVEAHCKWLRCVILQAGL